MNKEKWKERWEFLVEKLSFLRIDEDDLEDDIEIEERDLSEEDAPSLPEGNLKERLLDRQKMGLYRNLFVVFLAIVIAGGFIIYNRVHEFTDYVVTKSYENDVAAGSRYEAVGKYIYRYNSDGISCVTKKNEVKWSITYNMQAPIADVCEDVMVIAEQQGNKIYVVDKNGLIGNFETVLPILKVRVSRQGMVAAVLRENNVTWINLYQPDGTQVASDKTTLTESGYPLDIDISPNGQKLAVSYLALNDAIVRSDVVFYHFGSAGQAKENHIVSKISYQETVIPELFFLDNSKAAAVTDSGFLVFTGSDEPEESEKVIFEDEIISTFHGDDRIGFLFRSQEEGYAYRMELYNYGGTRKVSKNINANFDQIKVMNDQILMYNEEEFSIFTMAGRKRVSASYEKKIVNLFNYDQFRKYFVVTADSFDQIRIGG